MKKIEKNIRRWWLDVEILKNRKISKRLTGFSVPRNKFLGQDYETRDTILCFFHFLNSWFSMISYEAMFWWFVTIRENWTTQKTTKKHDEINLYKNIYAWWGTRQNTRFWKNPQNDESWSGGPDKTPYPGYPFFGGFWTPGYGFRMHVSRGLDLGTPLLNKKINP